MVLFFWHVRFILFIILICRSLNLGGHRGLEHFVNCEKSENSTIRMLLIMECQNGKYNATLPNSLGNEGEGSVSERSICA